LAIIERELPASGQWEVKATGDDIPKLSGLLNETGGEAYKKAFHHNEGIGFERVADPSGQETWVRKDEVAQALSNGYTGVAKIRMTMPEVPWKQNRLGPGKWRYKKDPETGKCSWTRV
jgi:hypothetical protein